MIYKTIFALSLTVGLSLSTFARADEPATAAPASAPRPVDVVICLDTSGSMEGLLDACRKKLWDLCSVLAQAQPAPRLRVALYSFGGNDGGEDGYVVQRSGFTEDLDHVYEELMKLRADGGSELVGRVLRRSLERLDWSQERGALKLIFVAGNESADQDASNPFRQACKDALQQRVVVHAIYCGPDQDQGDAGTWREVAQHGGGQFAAIDPNGGTVSVETPFDADMIRLSQALNATYLPFGARGRAACENQARQDDNSTSLGSSTGAARAQTKASGVYSNGAWDLVDACDKAEFDWAKIEEADLPEALRGKSQAEREAVIAALRAQRTAIQAQIQALAKQRQAFVDEALAAAATDTSRSIDAAMARAVRSQAEALGFRFQ
jgi:hypothetical protein